MAKTPLLGRTLDELKEIVLGLGMPKFTAGQIASWMYGKKVSSIDEMTNLSLKNRELLKASYEIGCSAPVHEMRSADGTVKFASYYDPQYSMWGGIAVAAAPDMTVSEQPIAQQFSVWAEGGANNTATYAVCYDSNTPTEAYPDYLTASGYPTITFSAARTVDHLWIANSSYVCSWFSGNDKALFEVKITGQKNGVETGSVTETLISGSDVLSGWRKVNLLSLGEIDRLTFKVSGIDVTADPTYFCIDEITLVK